MNPRRTFFSFVLAVSALGGSQLVAADLVSGAGTGLQATYYKDTTWSTVGLTRVDPQVNFDWGVAAPAAGIPVDGFSVRWVGYIEAPVTGVYTLTAAADDTAEVWIGTRLVMYQGRYQAAPMTGTVTLEAGRFYPISYAMLDNGVAAKAQLSWSYAGQETTPIPSARLFPVLPPTLPSGDGSGLTASYFPTTDVTGAATLTVLDPSINHVWGGHWPGSVVPVDNFSARWTGHVTPLYSELYAFSVTGDDGVRLWVNGQLLVDQWRDQSATEYTGTIALVAHQAYDIKFEYYEHGGGAAAKLAWSSPTQVKQIIPDAQLSTETGVGSGLTAAYFANSALSGAPALTRTDHGVNFDWGYADPVSATMASRPWAARWVGEIEAPTTDTYTLTTLSSGGVTVSVNNALVINDVAVHNEHAASCSVPLIGGKRVPITITYEQGGSQPALRLMWAATAVPAQVVPTDRLYPQVIDKTALSAFQAGSSLVSPAWVSGQVNRAAGSVTATVNGSARSVIRENANAWYLAGNTGSPAGVPLNALSETQVEIKAGAESVVRSIAWTPIDLNNTYGLDPLVIRVGDSLLISDARAVGTLEVDTAFNGKVFNPTVSGTPTPGVPVRYAAAGTYLIQARSGANYLGKLSVQVVGIDFQGPIACEITYPRKKTIAISHPSRVVFTTNNADALATSVSTVSGTDATLIIQPLTSETAWIEAHLGDANGPLVAAQTIDAFTLSTTAKQSIAIEETLVDGSLRGVAHLIMTPGIPALEVRIFAFVAGILFDNGTTHLNVNTSDFAMMPHYDNPLTTYFAYGLIRAPNVQHGFCHAFVVYQNNIQISY